MNQSVGVLIRCFYFHKGQALKFFLMYNVNILVFVFAMLFNKFILKVIQDSSGNSSNNSEINALQKTGQNQNYSNTMLILQGYVLMAGAFMSLPIY